MERPVHRHPPLLLLVLLLLLLLYSYAHSRQCACARCRTYTIVISCDCIVNQALARASFHISFSRGGARAGPRGMNPSASALVKQAAASDLSALDFILHFGNVYD